MKKTIFLISSFVLFLTLSNQAYAQEAFDITSFQDDITLNPDSTFSVTENIEVNFTQDRHGIFRDLDTQLISAEIKEVLNENDEPWNYTIESFDYGTRIKIGDANTLINGPQTYKIRYDVSGGIRFFEDHDELYWNATGNFWETYIKNASAVIHLPDGIRKSDITTACYTGSIGSEGDDCTANTADGMVTFFATREFQPYEGLTIVVGIPKGFLTQPASLKVMSNISGGDVYLNDNPEPSCEADCTLDLPPGNYKVQLKKWSYSDSGITEVGLSAGEAKEINIDVSMLWWRRILGATYALLMLFIGIEPIITFYRKGRDKGKDKTIIAEYEAPDKLPPVEMGSLVDERADMRDISSTIIDLAVRGFLTIKEIPGVKLWIFKTPNDYELIRTTPKPGKPTVLNEFENRLMEDIFESKQTKKLSELRNNFYTKLPKLKEIVYESLVKKEYFPQSPDKTRTKYIIKGFLLIFVSFFITFIEIAFLSTGFSTFIFINGFLTLIFARSMPQKTEKGTEAYQKILGFRLYMETAEKDRLKFQEKENLFYELLPYAMTLNIVKKWSKAFDGVLKDSPDWYKGNQKGFNMPVFINSMNSMSSQVQQSFASRSSSSGSGGSGFSGGFSGGGGGGGGGGSW